MSRARKVAVEVRRGTVAGSKRANSCERTSASLCYPRSRFNWEISGFGSNRPPSAERESLPFHALVPGSIGFNALYRDS